MSLTVSIPVKLTALCDGLRYRISYKSIRKWGKGGMRVQAKCDCQDLQFTWCLGKCNAEFHENSAKDSNTNIMSRGERRTGSVHIFYVIKNT